MTKYSKQEMETAFRSVMARKAPFISTATPRVQDAILSELWEDIADDLRYKGLAATAQKKARKALKREAKVRRAERAREFEERLERNRKSEKRQAELARLNHAAIIAMSLLLGDTEVFKYSARLRVVRVASLLSKQPSLPVLVQCKRLEEAHQGTRAEFIAAFRQTLNGFTFEMLDQWCREGIRIDKELIDHTPQIALVDAIMCHQFGPEGFPMTTGSLLQRAGYPVEWDGINKFNGPTDAPSEAVVIADAPSDDVITVPNDAETFEIPLQRVGTVIPEMFTIVRGDPAAEVQ